MSCHRSVSNLQSWAASSGHQPAHHEELGLLIARPMEALSGSPGESYFQDAQGQGEAAAKRSWRKLLILLMAFLESWEVFPKSGRVERREMPSREAWGSKEDPKESWRSRARNSAIKEGLLRVVSEGRVKKQGCKTLFFLR